MDLNLVPGEHYQPGDLKNSLHRVVGGRKRNASRSACFNRISRKLITGDSSRQQPTNELQYLRLSTSKYYHSVFLSLALLITYQFLPENFAWYPSEILSFNVQLSLISSP